MCSWRNLGTCIYTPLFYSFCNYCHDTVYVLVLYKWLYKLVYHHVLLKHGTRKTKEEKCEKVCPPCVAYGIGLHWFCPYWSEFGTVVWNLARVYLYNAALNLCCLIMSSSLVPKLAEISNVLLYSTYFGKGMRSCRGGRRHSMHILQSHLKPLVLTKT